jgi:transcriptional regulator with XRE-family HTH domain
VIGTVTTMSKFSPDALRRHRERANLGRAELAKRLGTSEQTVGYWERGERLPNANWLPLFAETLDCGIRDFFTSEVSTQARATGDQRTATA